MASLESLYLRALTAETARQEIDQGIGAVMAALADSEKSAQNHSTCPALNCAAGNTCSDSNPVFVTRTHWPNCTPAFSSFVITFGCTTMHMFSCRTSVGGYPAGRDLEPRIGWK